MFFKPCSSSLCNFDKVATTPILAFDFFTLLVVIILLFFLFRYQKKIVLKFGIMMLGIFLFEFFTHPMWYNYKIGSWAYVYRDVSWILTFGWSILILTPIVLVDKFLAKIDDWKRFFIYLGIVFILGLIGETLVNKLGIRSYAPETMEVIAGRYVPILGIPWATLYYIPVFTTLVICFYKYWSFVLDKKLLIPMKNIKWLRDFGISFVGVFLFEMMIEPMVVNAKLPAWSYIYRDVSLLLTGSWVIIIWLAISLVDKFLKQIDLIEKFVLYVMVATIITLPGEALLRTQGIRLYGPSTTANFSGFTIPLTAVPVEIFFAIPFYLALVIAFIKYWIFVLDNRAISIKK